MKYMLLFDYKVLWVRVRMAMATKVGRKIITKRSHMESGDTVPYENTYRSITMASLEGVAKRPDTPRMLEWRRRARMVYSRRICSRDRRRRLMNLTATYNG